MSRVLKRKSKSRNKLDSRSKLDSRKPDLTVAPKRIKRYKKQKCAFVDTDGSRCSRNAVGKSTLCKLHGGNPVVKENLIPNALVGIGGRFDPTKHPVMFIDLSREGLSEVEIAASFEVSVETMKGWAEKYEMFNVAFEIGKALHESWWITQGKGGLRDRGFNTSLFKFLTSNKLGYSDKMETKSMNMNVHGVLKVPDKMSVEEWEAEVIDADT